jgi:protein-S-isoprenylcysteine O-methyltransferase Ste14
MFSRATFPYFRITLVLAGYAEIAELLVPGGCAARNRGGDYVEHLAPALRRRNKVLDRTARTTQSSSACLRGTRRRSAPRLCLQTKMKKHVLPPTYLFFSITLMVLLHFLVPVSIFAVYPWNLLGVLPLITGITLNLKADTAFKKEQTTVKPFEKSSALITTGVFRVSRHPMYLGMILILLGIAILMGSLTPLIVIAIFTILIELVFVRTEEKMLEEQFGSSWYAYKNKVRKWI